MVFGRRCLPGLRGELLRRYPAVAFVFFLYPFSTCCGSAETGLGEKKKNNTTIDQARYLFGLDDHSISQP